MLEEEAICLFLYGLCNLSCEAAAGKTGGLNLVLRQTTARTFIFLDAAGLFVLWGELIEFYQAEKVQLAPTHGADEVLWFMIENLQRQTGLLIDKVHAT